MIKSTKVVGLNSDQQAIQAFIFPREDPSEDHPIFYIILSAVCDDAFLKTKQALSEIEDNLAGLDKPVSEALPSLVQLIEGKMTDAHEVNILIASVFHQVLYLCYQGKMVSAQLIRDQKAVNLLSVSAEKDLISGFMKKGDRVVLTTNTLLSVLKTKNYDLSTEPIETIEDQVESILPEIKSDPVALIVFEDYQPSVEKEPELIAETVPVPRTPKTSRFHFPKPTFPSVGDLKLQRKRLLVLLVVMSLLGGGVLIGWRQLSKGTAQNNPAFTQALSQAHANYQQAVSLKDQDPPAAKKSLQEASLELQQALKMYPKNSEALSLQKEIAENSDQIMKVYHLTDIPLWLDLNLVRQGFTSTKLSYSLGKFVVLDSSKKSLVVLNADNKSPQLLPGGDKVGNASSAAINGSNVFVFSGDNGIYKIDVGNNQLTTAVKKDENWGTIKEIYGFAGNVYLLDTIKNQIWKHIAGSSGYSDARTYFQGNADINGALRFHIDSSVWVLQPEGRLTKYTQGVADNFNFSGLETTIKDPKSFYVSDETEKVYLLDSGNNRIVVLTKTGQYEAQYLMDKMDTFIDLVVDEQKKKIFLFDGQKIYSTDLH